MCRFDQVKTMEAKIFTQDLLGDETATKPSKRFSPPPPPPPPPYTHTHTHTHAHTTGKGRIRRPSDVEYFRTMEALSRHLPLEETLDNEEEEEDDDGMLILVYIHVNQSL